MYHHSFELSLRYRNHTLISCNFLIRTYQLLLMCFQLPRGLVQNLLPSKLLRSLWIQNPMVSYCSAFAIGSSYQEIYPYATPEARAFFATNLREGNWENFAFRKVCLSHKPTPRASSKKSIQVLGTDNATLSAFTAEYEFHPHVLRIEQRWLQERACHSTAAHPVRSAQEWSTSEYFARNR